MTSFDDERRERIAANARNAAFVDSARTFMRESTKPKYSYNFDWLGRPIIQYPQDIVAMQELIFRIKPDLIVETGIAHGGSLIFSASMLELVAICGGPADARVLGIDIDIRAHNRVAIEAHPMMRRITMLEGSSVDPEIVAQVRGIARDAKRVLVCLDSNHTHAHVLAELEAYAPLVTPGSYCVVFDTVIENLPADMFPDRPWAPGDNAMTAVDAYLADHPEFEIDADMDAKLLISVAPRGYLRRVG
ncbi:cephalosporin hydroxylase family protein [Salinarimonas sp.]|uniref:cephalosporin hydroxylase family protein n=1 Tax=Salinarimonas sp. TaxID=2766526 RepID=UPI00391DF67A